MAVALSHPQTRRNSIRIKGELDMMKPRRALQRGLFGSNETQSFFATDATVEDPRVEIELPAPANGSQRVVLVHSGHGDPVAENGNGHAALDGDVRQVSVLMADLRGFTTFCERVSPGRMSRLLNEYL